MLAHRSRTVTLAKILSHRSIMVGIVLFLAILIPSIVGPLLSSRSPTAMTLDFLQPPSLKYIFGTDTFGRDIFIRVLYGSRVSLLIGLSVMLSTAVLGTAIGLLAGFFQRLDGILMRAMDVLMAFPSLLLALGIMAALGQKPSVVVIALTIVYTPRTARVVRGQVLFLREQDYIQAARAVGVPAGRILVRHLTPNVLSPLIVQSTFVFGYAILAEAGLSFIGIGIQPPLPSMGNILGDARTIIQEAPWMTFLPGVWVICTVMAVNIIGDGLREILDPRLTRG